MNEQDRLFFSALYEDRADSAKTLEKPSMRGVKKVYQISIRIRHILSMNCCKTLMIQAQREPSSFLNRGSLSLFIMAQGIFRCLTRQKKTAI